MQFQSWSRRRFLAACGFGVAAAGLGVACGQSSGQDGGLVGPGAKPLGSPGSLIGPTILPTVVASPTPGKLLIVLDGNFQIFDLSTMSATVSSHFPKGAFAASPSASPDRKQVAFTYYVVPTDQKDLGGSDLYTMDASGGNVKMVHSHGDPGATFEDPGWSADGQSILATRRTPIYNQGQYAGETLAVLKAGLDGSEPTTLIKNALEATASPDGKYLIYTAVDDKGQPTGLFRADVDGSNPTGLLANAGFGYIHGPHFSHDSTLITFAAVGGPTSSPPTPKVGWLPPGVGIAEAHGIPWDIWTVRPDGTGLKRLTYESEDTPTPVWSPDGKWVAFAGEIGLYLVDADGKQTVRFSTLVSGGGIAWLA
jgi:Tol biopolymer transport system component